MIRVMLLVLDPAWIKFILNFCVIIGREALPDLYQHLVALTISLKQLVGKGNSVPVIEHAIDFKH